MAVHPYFQQAPQVVPISHAGDSDQGDHNGSLVAYQRAYQHGFRWFQVDVVAIGDQRLASAHAIFGRRRSWETTSIGEVSAAAGRGVAALDDLLAAFPDVRWNIEVKSRRTLPGLLALLADPAVRTRVCVSSPFHRGLSRRLRRQFDDEVCLAAPLADGGLVGLPLWPWRRVRHDVVQVWLPLARSRRVVHRSLAAGRRFQVWTANSLRSIDRVLALGATGIITDRHELLLARLAAHAQQQAAGLEPQP